MSLQDTLPPNNIIDERAKASQFSDGCSPRRLSQLAERAVDKALKLRREPRRLVDVVDIHGCGEREEFGCLTRYPLSIVAWKLFKNPIKTVQPASLSPNWALCRRPQDRLTGARIYSLLIRWRSDPTFEWRARVALAVPILEEALYRLGSSEDVESISQHLLESYLERVLLQFEAGNGRLLLEGVEPLPPMRYIAESDGPSYPTADACDHSHARGINSGSEDVAHFNNNTSLVEATGTELDHGIPQNGAHIQANGRAVDVFSKKREAFSKTRLGCELRIRAPHSHEENVPNAGATDNNTRAERLSPAAERHDSDPVTHLCNVLTARVSPRRTLGEMINFNLSNGGQALSTGNLLTENVHQDDPSQCSEKVRPLCPRSRDSRPSLSFIYTCSKVHAASAEESRCQHISTEKSSSPSSSSSSSVAEVIPMLKASGRSPPTQTLLETRAATPPLPPLQSSLLLSNRSPSASSMLHSSSSTQQYVSQSLSSQLSNPSVSSSPPLTSTSLMISDPSPSLPLPKLLTSSLLTIDPSPSLPLSKPLSLSLSSSLPFISDPSPSWPLSKSSSSLLPSSSSSLPSMSSSSPLLLSSSLPFILGPSSSSSLLPSSSSLPSMSSSSLSSQPATPHYLSPVLPSCIQPSSHNFQETPSLDSEEHQQMRQASICVHAQPTQYQVSACENGVQASPVVAIHQGIDAEASRVSSSPLSTPLFSMTAANGESSRGRGVMRLPLSKFLAERDECKMESMEAWEEPTAQMDPLCCVCMVGIKGAAFIPCGHTFCRKCSRELWRRRGACPLCNRSIRDILDVY